MGVLTLTPSVSSAAVNLTTVCTTDWATYNGATKTGTTVNAVNTKSGGGASITLVCPDTMGNYGNDPRTISWSNGTPNASGSTTAGVYDSTNTSNDFTFTLPASTTAQIAYFYIGGYQVTTSSFAASLSDSSASPQSYTGFTAGGSGVAYVVAVNYQTNSNAQTLTVVWKITAGSGNVTVQAAGIAPGSTNVTVSLTGQRVTSTAGTIKSSSTLTLSGTRSTFTPGSLGIQNARTLTGQRITSTTGSLAGTRAVGLSGLRATFSAGTITASTGGNVTVNLTGARITSVAGSLTAARALSLTGSRVTSASGTLVAAKSLGLSGLRMTASAGTLSDTRSLGLTGLRINSAAGTITASQSSPNVTVTLNGARITSRQGVITASGGSGSGNLPPTVGFICNVATLDNHHA